MSSGNMPICHDSEVRCLFAVNEYSFALCSLHDIYLIYKRERAARGATLQNRADQSSKAERERCCWLSVSVSYTL